MKKNLLSYMILLFGVMILSTGCTITANTDISFDNKDNMKVETTVLFPRELMAYSDNSTSNDDLTKDTETLIDGINVETEVQEVDSNDGVGNKRIEICKNLSRAKKVEQIGFITAQNADIGVLIVKNYLLFKKYLLSGQIMKPEDVKSYDSSVNPNSLISSKVRIQVPSQAKGVKSNTEIKDADNQNIYVWKIDYTAVNPINIEFYMLNWGAIIATVIVLLLLTLYLLNSGKGNFDFSVILEKSKEFFSNTAPKKQTTTTETKTIVKPKQKKNPAKFIVITLVLLCIIGVPILFSLPTICNILVDNSIKSVYVGETAKAVQIIEIANALNFDKNTDLSKEIFAKGLKEIENNDTKTAKVLFDLVAKTKTKNFEKYSQELSDIAVSALNMNQLAKSKNLIEAAAKFDLKTAQKTHAEFAKKNLTLYTAKKYNEALTVCDILLTLKPNNYENWFRKSLVLMNLDRKKEAVETFTKTINLKNDFATAYLNRGYIYQTKLAEYDKALYDFNQVIRYSSDKKQIALARISIAEIYTKKKEYRKAMDSAWMAKELYELLGNYEKADECFRYFDYVAELECNRPNGYCY